MSIAVKSLKEIHEKYKEWVLKNPGSVNNIEMIVRVAVPFLLGRGNKSLIVSEFAHSFGQLLNVYNDQIIFSSKQILGDIKGKIKFYVTILNCFEVFIEKTSLLIFGEKQRWIAITVIQLVKCISRLTLIFYYKERIVCCPPNPVQSKNLVESNPPGVNGESSSGYFVLKRSGKAVRKVAGAPSSLNRDWIAPVPYTQTKLLAPKDEALRNILIAEVIFTFKPVIHLVSWWKFGSSTWKQWLIPLIMDLISLNMLAPYRSTAPSNNSLLTKTELREISRRYSSLLLYLLRSPFYDKYTQFPVTGLIFLIGKLSPRQISVLVDSLDYFLNTYFYIWSC